MRGDKTFAYDLVMSLGAVNSRVVLLLRSIEAQPRWFSFVEIHPHLSLCMAQKVEGGSVLALGKLAALEDWVGGKKTHPGVRTCDYPSRGSPNDPLGKVIPPTPIFALTILCPLIRVGYLIPFITISLEGRKPCWIFPALVTGVGPAIQLVGGGGSLS